MTTPAARRRGAIRARLPRAGTSGTRRPRTRRPRARTRGDRGVASLEYLGMLPFLLLVALAGIQLGLAAYCAEQAGTAARTAARTASEPSPHGDPAQAGRNAVSGWVDPRISFPGAADANAVTATATVDVPSVIPGLSIFGPVHRSATMPKEDTTP
ncbi:TadE-like protein [Actinacidiphila rubida]|uniref:TadE-like protein n=1 Tax=Actinacidiphila rubida TaxID=310780 RepID=A0A1H8HHM3_9ACTN|nr:TadE-like protein [Actinacidiphila rubida]